MLGRLLSRRRGEPVEPPPLVPGGPVPVMARTGRPGSLSEDQLEALEANRFLPPPPLSRLSDLSAEEAASILAALDYVRAAIRQVVGEDAPTPVENELLALVLADESFSGQALRWSQGGMSLPLKETALFSRLKSVVMSYWQPAQGQPAQS
jgi:hypothetical protein